MGIFELRGRSINIASADVYENSRWEAPVVGQITDEMRIVQAVVLATRTRKDAEQKPYAYIERDVNSGAGIWLNEADYTVVEPEWA